MYTAYVLFNHSNSDPVALQMEEVDNYESFSEAVEDIRKHWHESEEEQTFLIVNSITGDHTAVMMRGPTNNHCLTLYAHGGLEKHHIEYELDYDLKYLGTIVRKV